MTRSYLAMMVINAIITLLNKGLFMSDVVLTRNYEDMSVNMIYDNCTVVVSANQRLGLWQSDHLITLGFKKAIDHFRTTEIGKSVESAAFKFINTGVGLKYEPIPKSFDMTSHDYYMNLK